MGEFELIEQYFKPLSRQDAPNSVDLGIGDDCALVSIPNAKQLAVSSDSLISGVHFPVHASPQDIGFKSLAVNLSDLAAMGAEPAWFSLCLTLPPALRNEQWVAQFCQGMQQLIQQIPITLIGGDTTCGDQLTISIQVMGLVERGKALCRSGAKAGDDIYVSGCFGEAALGLFLEQNAVQTQNDAFEKARQRLNRPLPRSLLIRHIKTFVSACIDVSDGLLADLNHILVASKLGAELQLNHIPIAETLLREELLAQVRFPLQNQQRIRRWAISAGDDYELCFTVPQQHREEFETLSNKLPNSITRIGQVVEGWGIAHNNKPIQIKGYQHF